jgi:putative phage-type endonuclease
MNRWKSPLQVWMEKTNAVPLEEKKGIALTVGTELENLVAKMFTGKTGLAVRRVNKTLIHKEHDFIRANIDRDIVGHDAILECKTASAYKADEWKDDEIPAEYIFQCVHYLAVTGAKKCYLAVLIGNQDFQVKTIDRNEEMIKDLIDKEVEFWETYIVAKKMPIFMTADDDDNLKKLFPEAVQGESMEFVDAESIDKKINEIKEFEEEIKIEVGRIAVLKNDIKAIMQHYETGVAGEWKATWKNQKQTKFDKKALKEKYPDIAKEFTTEGTNRVFRTSKNKEVE